MDGKLELIFGRRGVYEIIIDDASREVLLALAGVLQVLLAVGDIEIVAHLLDLGLALLDALHGVDQEFYLAERAVVLQVARPEQVVSQSFLFGLVNVDPSN